jgi:hypothetical protein
MTNLDLTFAAVAQYDEILGFLKYYWGFDMAVN